MSKGEELKSVFEKHLLPTNGGKITIYKKFGTDAMTSLESLAIKKKNHFEFSASVDVNRGDGIQLEGTKSFWRVVDIDEELIFGTVRNLNVQGIRIDELGNEIKFNNEGKAVFNAPVYGGVQIGGTGNTQHINLSNTEPQIIQAFIELTNIANGANDLDKEEILSEIEILKRLSEKEKTPEVLERVEKRVNLLKTALETAGLLSAGAPYIELILKAWGIL